MRELLSQIARDYDDIAEDLETGAVRIRHAELMPQRRRGRPVEPPRAVTSKRHDPEPVIVRLRFQ